ARWRDDSVWGASAGVVGFILRSGIGLRAAAAVCDVVRDDFLLVLDGGNAGWREAGRRGEGQPAAVGIAACVQRCANQSCEVLRQYSVCVRDRIEGARAEAG